jgi:hypothetical protein
MGLKTPKKPFFHVLNREAGFCRQTQRPRPAILSPLSGKANGFHVSKACIWGLISIDHLATSRQILSEEPMTAPLHEHRRHYYGEAVGRDTRNTIPLGFIKVLPASLLSIRLRGESCR